MKPADMKEKIQDAGFREKLKTYLEDIIKEDLDDFKEKRIFQSSNGKRTFFQLFILIFCYSVHINII